MEICRTPIQEGIDSDIAVGFNPDELLLQLKKERSLNGLTFR